MAVIRRLAFAAALAIVLAGCGDQDGGSEGRGPAAVETIDPVPALPPGWTVRVNRSGGFAFGLPPGWIAEDRRISTLVRSLDRLVAVSITPDRTDEALTLTPARFAARAVAALPGYRLSARPGRPRPFEHRYAASSVEAEGEATSTGVGQRIEVVALRRGDLATLTVAIAANDDPRSRPAERLASRLIETLRTRPVTPASVSG